MYQVHSIFEDDGKKHVKDFQHDIVWYRDILLDQEFDQSITDDHFAEDRRRRERSKRPINLHDLFGTQAWDSNSSSEPVKRVLLVGLPGSGKTSISKSFAYQWAGGEIGQSFRSVYVVPVRNLTKVATQSFGCEDLFANAISKFCFPRLGDADGHNKLKIQIQIDLWKPSTLLIIDGLDEGDDDGRPIIQQVLQWNCALLLTSRPYYLSEIRKHVDAEMECLGLNDTQVVDFVHGNLQSPWGTLMLQFLKDRPSVWEMAHIPVNLIIFCSLWSAKKQSKEFTHFRLEKETLYSQMIHLIWLRFVEKTGSSWNAKEVFEALEKIAFEAQMNRKALIDRCIVKKHIRETSLHYNVFRKAGFLLLKMEGGFYQFPHLSFQEHLSGKRLSRLLFLSTQQDKMEAIRLISAMKYDEKHSATIFSMVQEACFVKSDAIETILAIVDQYPRDVIGLQHLVLKLRIVEAFFSVNEEAIPRMASFDVCLEIVRTGTSIIGACENKNAFTETLLRKFVQLPNTIRVITKFLGTEMTKITRAALNTRDPELSAHFLKQSTKELKMFVESIDNDPHELLPETLLDVCFHLPLKLIEKLGFPYLERFLSFLASQCLKKETHLREKSSKLIGQCIVSSPNLIFKIELLMMTNWMIQNELLVLDRCFQIVKECCAGSNAAIHYVKPKCLHENGYIRRRALQHVSEIAVKWTEEVTFVLDILLQACGDEEAIVRSEAFLQLLKIAKLFPNEEHQFWSKVALLIDDVNDHVRLTATKHLGELAVLFPTHKNEAWKLLVTKCFNENGIVQLTALSVLQNASRNMSSESKHEAWQVLQLSTLQYPKHNVRVATLKNVVDFAQSFPNFEFKAWNLLKSCTQDENVDIQRTALEHIFLFVRCFHRHESEAWQLLLEHCRSQNEDVRAAAKTQAIEFLQNFEGSKGKALELLRESAKRRMGKVFDSDDLMLITFATHLPEYHEEVWSHLSKHCISRNKKIRDAAFRDLSKMSKIFPEIREKGWKILAKSCNSDDWDELKAALSVLEDMTKLLPGKRREAWATLARCCRHEHWEVRKMAVRQLSEMVKFYPEKRKEAWEMLSELCRDEFWEVRNAVLYQLPDLPKFFSDDGDEFWSLFSQCFRGEDEDVPNSRIGYLTAILEFFPEDEELNFLLFSKCCDSKESSIRKAAICQLPNVVKKLYNHGIQVWELLSRFLHDANGIVRRTAVDQLPNIAKILPENETAWKLFAERCNDPLLSVRNTVASQLSDMVKQFPQNREKAMELLIKCIHDESWEVRTTATGQLSDIAKRFPKKRKHFWKLLLNCGNDRNWEIRKTAVRQLLDMAKLCFVHGTIAWNLLSRFCEDEDRNVRIDAVNQMLDMAKAFPDSETEAWDFLSRCCCHEDRTVQTMAINKLSNMLTLFPENRETAWRIIATCCCCEESEIRKQAVRQILRMLKWCPGMKNEGWVLLLRGTEDPDISVQNVSIQSVTHFVKQFPEFWKEGWDVIVTGSHAQNKIIRIAALQSVAGFAKKIPVIKKEACKMLSNGFHDPDYNIKRVVFQQFSEVAKDSNENEMQIWRTAIADNSNGGLFALKGDAGNIVGLTEISPNPGSHPWQKISDLCNHSDFRIRCSAIDLITKLSLSLPQDGSKALSILSEACRDTDSRIRTTVVQQIATFVSDFPRKLSEARRLLFNVSMREDYNLDIRQSSFNLYIDLWKRDVNNRLPGPSHFLKVAKRIGSSTSLLPVIDLCSNLLKTHFAEEAANVIIDAYTTLPEGHREKVSRMLRNVSLKMLHPLCVPEHFNCFRPLVPRFLSSSIILDCTIPRRCTFSFFDSIGRPELELPFAEGLPLIRQIQDVFCTEYPLLFGTLNKYSSWSMEEVDHYNGNGV